MIFWILGFGDFGIWGSGTRLWRPGEPREGRIPGEPGARTGRYNSPVTLEPSKDPFRQSLIGEKSMPLSAKLKKFQVSKGRISRTTV